MKKYKINVAFYSEGEHYGDHVCENIIAGSDEAAKAESLHEDSHDTASSAQHPDNRLEWQRTRLSRRIQENCMAENQERKKQMNIRWVKDTMLEIIEYFDEETEEAETVHETFQKGEHQYVDIVDEDKERGTVNIQFGDGSMAYGVPKDRFVEN